MQESKERSTEGSQSASNELLANLSDEELFDDFRALFNDARYKLTYDREKMREIVAEMKKRGFSVG